MDILYDCRWSFEIDEKFIDDFLSIRNLVFFPSIATKDRFTTRFISNIYGPSLLVVAYQNRRAVGARSFWRNDVGSCVAYQPGDTSVLSEYRNRGIFYEMTRIALDNIKEPAIVYNFPNEKSLPGYLKMGWKIQSTYKTRASISLNEYIKEKKEIIESDYAKWWLLSKANGFEVIHSNRKYFLIKRRGVFRYSIVGELNHCFEYSVIRPYLSIYQFLSKKETFYNKKRRALNVVIYNKNCSIVPEIPLYKIDAL